jgi:hypothetical protein
LIALHSLPSSKDLQHAIGGQQAWRELFQGTQCKITEHKSGDLGQYIALSYCWGSHLPLTTTTENLAKHQSRIDFIQIPRMLQDAIMLTRFLDFDHIWIDCLCIVQNDRADWQREAGRVAEIYFTAALTIAASQASHCDEGFLQPRPQERWDCVTLKDEKGAFDLCFMSEHEWEQLLKSYDGLTVR